MGDVPHAPCAGCQQPTLYADENGIAVEGKSEWFMLNPGLWDQVMRTGERWLCVGCIEARIGRRLMPSDFAVLRSQQTVSPMDTPRLASRKYQREGIYFGGAVGDLIQPGSGWEENPDKMMPS